MGAEHLLLFHNQGRGSPLPRYRRFGEDEEEEEEWSPLDLGNDLEIWYDFSDISTLYQDTSRTNPVTANNQYIYGLEDKSGKGRHNRKRGGNPQYKANLKNGLSGIWWPGNAYMYGADVTISQPFTVITAVYHSTDSPDRIVGLPSAGTESSQKAIISSSSNVISGVDTFLINQWNIVSYLYTTQNLGYSTIRMNGAVIKTGWSGNNGTQRIVLSSSQSAYGNNYWYGYYAELIWVKDYASDMCETVEAYLSNKWDIALS